jgi:hypothetical protein
MMQIGTYVQYKSEPFIILAIIADKAHILSPVVGKRFVKLTQLTYIPRAPATHVVYRDTEYLVTRKGLIISLQTRKIMNWGENNGNRIAILKEATVERHKERNSITQ